MRLYLKRAALALVGLFSLTGILIIQSVTNFQRHGLNRMKAQVALPDKDFSNPIADHNNNKIETASLRGAEIFGHEELYPESVDSKVSLFDNHPRFRPDPKNAQPLPSLDPDLLNLASFLPKDVQALENYCSNQITLAQHFKKRYGQIMPKKDIWEKFYAQIGLCDLYRADSPIIDELLQTLSTMPILHISNLDSGTQVKFLIVYKNGKKALFKPMRFSRSFETHPNQFYFTDFERHNAEIAAFHLDRLLGFRRAVPTVGRVVNMTLEFLPHADKALARTFFFSPAKNLCFVGKCDYYCDTTHAICGSPDLVEGSYQAFLPDDEEVPRDHNRSPYRRTYSKRSQQAAWQKDHTYCNWKVKYKPPFSNGRALLDLVDLYILDFLIGNQDRHHYETFTIFDQTASFVHLDNGRAFGKTLEDDLDILAPLAQCCVIRPATLHRLLSFYRRDNRGKDSLGDALRRSLRADPVTPVLAEPHYTAIDRRLEIVLRIVKKCLDTSGQDPKRILVNEFYNPDAPTHIDDDEEDDD